MKSPGSPDAGRLDTDLDAVVLAGGRITGLFAREAGTPVKALASVEGRPVLHAVLDALAGTGRVGRVCVVGAPELAPALPPGVLHEAEGASALENLRRGLERLAGPPDRRTLVCAADLAALTPEAVADFLDRAPTAADFSMPLVRKEAFVRAFPGDVGLYVHLADGAYGGCGVFLVRPGSLFRSLGLVERLYAARKNQLALARILGAPFLLRLLTRRLTVAEIERRLSELTCCRCAAVPDGRPELAFDLDSAVDLRYWRRRVRKDPGSGMM